MIAVNINPGAPAHGSADQRRPWVANNGQGHEYAQQNNQNVAVNAQQLNPPDVIMWERAEINQAVAQRVLYDNALAPAPAPVAASPKPAPLPNIAPQHTSINCCGIAQLTNIGGARNGSCQFLITDPKSGNQTYVEKSVEESIIHALKCGGFMRQTYKDNDYKQPDSATWDNTVGYTAAVMWTDADYVGAGKVLADFFIQKGYKVQCTDIGINPKYGTKEHFLRHWVAFTGPKGCIGKDAETLSITREYRYVDEQKQQEPAKESVVARNPSGYTAARVRKFGRVAGAGVRAARTGGPTRTIVR